MYSDKADREKRREADRPRRAKDTLRDLEVRPTKETGQNFLIRPDIVDQIVGLLDVPLGAKVVEIGPGTRALT